MRNGGCRARCCRRDVGGLSAGTAVGSWTGSSSFRGPARPGVTCPGVTARMRPAATAGAGRGSGRGSSRIFDGSPARPGERMTDSPAVQVHRHGSGWRRDGEPRRGGPTTKIRAAPDGAGRSPAVRLSPGQAGLPGLPPGRRGRRGSRAGTPAPGATSRSVPSARSRSSGEWQRDTGSGPGATCPPCCLPRHVTCRELRQGEQSSPHAKPVVRADDAAFPILPPTPILDPASEEMYLLLMKYEVKATLPDPFRGGTPVNFHNRLHGW